MTVKGKAGRVMAYMLIVLLLLLSMTTAIAYTAAGSVAPFSGIKGHGTVENTDIHNGLGDPDSAEVLEEIYPTWDIQLEYQALRDTFIVPAVTVLTDEDSPLNSLFVPPEEVFMKLDSGIISAFLKNKDGMK